jgi:riboflavin synthase
MFSGIITHTGKISSLKKNKNNCVLEIISKIKFNKSEIGSSISCSGVCLTLEKYSKNLIRFYISKETLNRTIFNFSKNGDVINLEKS